MAALKRCYDVAVVGGGPAGAACAAELARLGLDVAWVVRQAARETLHGEMLDPPAAALLVRTFGDELPPRWPTVARRTINWGSAARGTIAHTFWHATTARVVDRSDFGGWLSKAVVAFGASVASQAGLKRAEPFASGWRLECGDGAELAASFLVEATGAVARSPALKDAGRLYIDRQVCRSVVVERDRSDRNDAFVEAGLNGWAYSVPVGTRRRLIAWFGAADRPETANASELRHLLGQLDLMRRFPVPAGTPVRTHCARTSVRTPLWRGRWLAVGDAAWALDPLSGNGIARAVEDGARASHAVAAKLRANDDGALRDHATAQATAFVAAVTRRADLYATASRLPPS